jgi:hypothetical protein
VRSLESGLRPDDGHRGNGPALPRDVVQQQTMDVGKVELF